MPRFVFLTLFALAAVVLLGCEGAITHAPPRDVVMGPTPDDPHSVDGGSGADAGNDPVDPAPVLPEFVPAPLGARLLTAQEYVRSVQDLLGAPASPFIQAPPELLANGSSSLGASQLSASPAHIRQYETNSLEAAAAAFANASNRAALVKCTPKSATDAACFGTFVDAFGRRAFRRPLEADERTSWVQLGVQAATAYNDFFKGAQFIAAGMLESPSFLYRAEVGVADSTVPGGVRLTGLELATRLSFALVGTTPSDAMLDAALAGSFDTVDGLRAQAEKLLAAPQARGAFRGLVDELFQLNELPSQSRQLADGGSASPALPSMAEAARLYWDEQVFTADADVRDIFTSTHAYVDARTAPFYGVTAPATGFARVQLPPGRTGFFAQLAFPTMFAHAGNSAPTLRGKFIREKLLCMPIAPPPPGINTSLSSNGGQPIVTARDASEARLKNAACTGCHTLMDPIGFGFEAFGQAGERRATDNGVAVNTSGTLDGVSFADHQRLSNLLHDDARVPRCFVRTTFRQVLGHLEIPSEARALASLDDAFQTKGYRMKALLLELTLSDAFRYASPWEAP